jgi:translation initiation factor 1 (eIF-1/SUI1)
MALNSKFFNIYDSSDSELSESESESDLSESDVDDSNQVSNLTSIPKAKAKAKAKAKSRSKSRTPKSDHEVSFYSSEILSHDYKINIRIEQRNSRKHTTSIEDIPEDFFDNKDLTKLLLQELRKKLTSYAVVKKANGQRYIEVAGNSHSKIREVLKKYIDIKDENILIHGVC